jgi:CheY-like chemotaxis protein
MKTILVVDDEASLRQILTDYLVEEGYTVLSAGDGLGALEQLNTGTPNLVITDFMMPRLDGLDLIHGMRARPHLQAVPVILASAAAVSPILTELGRVTFLRKPYDLDILGTIIGDALAAGPDGS